MDNGKVIKELHDAIRYLEDKEWSDRGASPHIDAINDALALLKEQEAVEPIPYHRSDGTIFKYECRKCRTKIFKGDLFCRHCSNPVLWKGR